MSIVRYIHVMETTIVQERPKTVYLSSEYHAKLRSLASDDKRGLGDEVEHLIDRELERRAAASASSSPITT